MYTPLDEVYIDRRGVSVRNIFCQIKHWMASKLSYNFDYVMCSYILFLIRNIAGVSDTITLYLTLNMNIPFNKPTIPFPTQPKPGNWLKSKFYGFFIDLIFVHPLFYIFFETFQGFRMHFHIIGVNNRIQNSS